ncbi:ASKHA domain-containing protein [Desulfotomaculum copahuensis]|uniref:Ferredoxin n=1 Tax=Desulfotomaculum copahuensis TaxID=1838280 RepID=A0A1B7LFN7_9FIRM|nr:ASKHA domain-containing protein [Desulfotomaculum copahuensis]OAT82971.1 ferredoxin [Desulfotomaculum copahuensis]
MASTVIFQPSGRRGQVEQGKTLLEAARELGVDIESVCGGVKVCGKCKVKIEEGFFEKFGIDSRVEHLSPLQEEEKDFLTEEELADNFRLACCCEVNGDVLLFVPEESRGAKQVVLETGKERTFQINPAVHKYYIEMEPATLEDHRGDVERIKDTLAEKYGLPKDMTIDYFLLRRLPNIVRDAEWKVTVSVWNNKEIILVEPGLAEHSLGLAIDIGTTTVAAYLCDLRTGQSLVVDSMMNPQVRYGEDVLSRITYHMMNDDGLEKMHQAIIEGINTLAQRMTEKIGQKPEDILEVTLVFNTAMQHIALGMEPGFLGRSPFTAGTKESQNIKARDLGIKVCKGANVHTLPVEAGFVGPDNVAVLIAEEPYKEPEKIRMVIDIGTNGEIDIGNAKKLLCTSCATGPALEGAQIKFGMRAAPGAIEKVIINPETLEVSYKVIGQDSWYPDIQKTEAKGICGSGIIDMVAQLFLSGVIDKSGRFNLKLNHPRVRRGEDGKPEYVVAWADETSIGKDVAFTQADVRAVQLAKSALYVGSRYLMEKLGVENLDSVTLAGAFGSYIDKESAMVIGMFPDCDLENVAAVGNAAGDGAKLALLDTGKREEATWIARHVEFVETAIEPDFQMRFAAAMAFPHSTDKFPHIQHLLDRIPKR